MTIKAINGTNVYVISAEVPRAKDGRGKAYSTLYTDMRWKIWGEIQASALHEVELESALYKAKMESINDQIKQQRKLLADLQSGAIEAKDAVYIEQARFERSMREAQARQTVRESTSTGLSSGSSGGGTKVSGGSLLEGADKTSLDNTVARASDEVAKSGGKLGDYARALEARVESDLGSGGGINPDSHDSYRHDAVADAVSKARAAATDNGQDPEQAEQLILGTFKQSFQDSYLAGGGSARQSAGFSSVRASDSNSRPLVPVTDTSAPEIKTADRTEEINRLVADIQALEASRDQVTSPNLDLYQRTREEYASRIGPGNFGVSARPQRRQELFDEQAALQNAMKILDYKKELGGAETEAAKARAKYVAESEAIGAINDPEVQSAIAEFDKRLDVIKKQKAYLDEATSRSVKPNDFLRDVAPPEQPVVPSTPVIPQAPKPKPDPMIELGDPSTYGTFNSDRARVGIGEGTFGTSEPTGPKYNSSQLETQALELTDEELKELNDLGYSIPGRTNVLPASASSAIPVAVETVDVEVPNVKRRESNYKINVTMEGIQLAKTSKKFERISKSSLPTAERQAVIPEYVKLVESLYNTSTSSSLDPLKNTYAEISKAYKDDPQTMRRAHVYLFAMHTVNNKKPE